MKVEWFIFYTSLVMERLQGTQMNQKAQKVDNCTYTLPNSKENSTYFCIIRFR